MSAIFRSTWPRWSHPDGNDLHSKENDAHRCSSVFGNWLESDFKIPSKAAAAARLIAPGVSSERIARSILMSMDGNHAVMPRTAFRVH